MYPSYKRKDRSTEKIEYVSWEELQQQLLPEVLKSRMIGLLRKRTKVRYSLEEIF